MQKLDSIHQTVNAMGKCKNEDYEYRKKVQKNKQINAAKVIDKLKKYFCMLVGLFLRAKSEDKKQIILINFFDKAKEI